MYEIHLWKLWIKLTEKPSPKITFENYERAVFPILDTVNKTITGFLAWKVFHVGVKFTSLLQFLHFPVVN